MLSPAWLDELRTRITLSNVISRTTKLQKAGREFKACCPFHNEKSPSFTVNDEKGFYHCFGCGAHGDAIRWMTDQRGLTFMDAVKDLAAEAGMEVPAADPRAAQQAEERSGLHEVMSAAQEWFKANLASPDGAKAREYLGSRGFDAHTIERFGFGFAPDSRGAMKQALGDRFTEKLLIEAGLLIQVDDRDPYDRFRARLMLPIEDARGRVIAFGGRILDSTNTKAPKYLNSPDTPLFDKGRILYNLHRAGPLSRQSGRMAVVEGYMDVIALAAAGIGEAVAPLGTALTENQIELLWRMVDVPVLCFDGDAAGQRAAIRAATRALPLLRPGKSLAIVRMPAGLDPDDLIKQQGKQALMDLLAAPASLLETLWEHERNAQSLSTPEDKAGLKKRLRDHADMIQDPDIRSLYLHDLLERFSDFAYPPRARHQNGWGQNNRGQNNRGQQNWRPQRGNGRGWNMAGPDTRGLTSDAAGRLNRATGGGLRDALAQAVIAGLARFPDQIARHGEALSKLAPPGTYLGRTVDILLDSLETLDSGEGTPISALGSFAVAPDNARFTFLMEGSDPQGAREDLAEAVSLLVERPALEAAIADATVRFEQTFEQEAFDEQQRLLKRKLEFERRLGQMASQRAAVQAAGSAPTAPDDPVQDEQELE